MCVLELVRAHTACIFGSSVMHMHGGKNEWCSIFLLYRGHSFESKKKPVSMLQGFTEVTLTQSCGPVVLFTFLKSKCPCLLGQTSKCVISRNTDSLCFLLVSQRKCPLFTLGMQSKSLLRDLFTFLKSKSPTGENAEWKNMVFTEFQPSI